MRRSALLRGLAIVGMVGFRPACQPGVRSATLDIAIPVRGDDE